jgi:hypothetical protein
MKNQFTQLVLLIALTCSYSAVGQTDTLNPWEGKPSLTLSGFLDVYYIYDFNKPIGSSRQSFVYNHNRHNEFNLNLGLIKMNVEHAKYRANLALHAGTYSNDNYSAEPGLLKNIFEANVGVSLNKKNNLWLDAGIMPSHIGFESAISMDCWTLTRSMLAENSPYFLSGAKMTYKPSDKLEMAALVINGWQRIQRLNGNSMLSYGTQIKWTPSKKASFNWSTFIGTNDPDSTRRMRYFNNFYGQFQLSEKVGLITGFDIGIQQESKGNTDYKGWFSPVIIGQMKLSKNLKTAIRVEYYQDATGIMIPTGTSNGFMTSGVSMNLDYSPSEFIVCRIEGSWLNSKDAIFKTQSAAVYNSFILGASMALKFSEKLGK